MKAAMREDWTKEAAATLDESHAKASREAATQSPDGTLEEAVRRSMNDLEEERIGSEDRRSARVHPAS